MNSWTKKISPDKARPVIMIDRLRSVGCAAINAVRNAVAANTATLKVILGEPETTTFTDREWGQLVSAGVAESIQARRDLALDDQMFRKTQT
jgi:hypothetical protein